MLFCYYYLLNCTSSWRQRLPHGYLCSLLVCYTIYPIKGLTSWRLAFRFCVPQGHFIVLQFKPRCQCQEKSTSLMCRFLISFHWVGLVINVCGPFSWNARVLFNFTLSPSLKRSLKLALNNSGNQGLSIKTKLFFFTFFSFRWFIAPLFQLIVTKSIPLEYDFQSKYSFKTIIIPGFFMVFF